MRAELARERFGGVECGGLGRTMRVDLRVSFVVSSVWVVGFLWLTSECYRNLMAPDSMRNLGFGEDGNQGVKEPEAKSPGAGEAKGNGQG